MDFSGLLISDISVPEGVDTDYIPIRYIITCCEKILHIILLYVSSISML